MQTLRKHYCKVCQIFQRETICYKVQQVLQSLTRSYCKVWQILQSVIIITKWNIAPDITGIITTSEFNWFSRSSYEKVRSKMKKSNKKPCG